MKKTQMDLKKAEREIERLKDQLEKAYGRHNKKSSLINRSPARKSGALLQRSETFAPHT